MEGIYLALSVSPELARDDKMSVTNIENAIKKSTLAHIRYKGVLENSPLDPNVGLREGFENVATEMNFVLAKLQRDFRKEKAIHA